MNRSVLSATCRHILIISGLSLLGSVGNTNPLSGLTPAESAAFDRSLDVFQEVNSVKGTEPGADSVGLGPRFNSNSCVSCHAHPAVGGTSPAMNPLIAVATQFGAQNIVPYFIKSNGPIREARFKFTADGKRDGGVKNLFVISGRNDAKSCHIAQPDFNKAAQENNIIFRIPTPVFGAGLIEQIPDATIIANKLSRLKEKMALGISGHENRNGNDGTISRFGWKAQNKSLMIFSGEAYNVEQGVTNELFQTERDETRGCVLNPTPEDGTNLNATRPLDLMSDVTAFAIFMRFLAPLPTLSLETLLNSASLRGPASVSETAAMGQIRQGAQIFSQIGCVHCHTPSLITGESASAALSKVKTNLYSDLLVHHMGPNLADDIIQGTAGPDEFRTAPLWGVGQRLFLLHDGRTSDMTEAIQAHASGDRACSASTSSSTVSSGPFCASEANQVIRNFNALSPADKQALIAFVKSL